jgi:hypothetical protein
MGLKLKYDNCVNCGAVVRGYKCAYCGTEYMRETVLDTYYPCLSGTYQSFATGYPHYSWTSQPHTIQGSGGPLVYMGKNKGYMCPRKAELEHTSPDVGNIVENVVNVVEAIIDLGC